MSNRYFEALDSLKLNYLHNQTVLIAGSTGMIGSCLVDAIMHANLHANLNCRVFAFGRREQAARRRFYGWYDHPLFQFCAQDVNEPIEHFTENIDFLIHAASNADPVRFATAPVETLLANVLGTKHLLELGRTHNMARFLFVSSGEMYGQPDGNPDGFVETYCGQIDHASPRSCYPAGKRAAEVLCQSYIAEYGVDAVIVRPCHIFGPTMTEHDSRALSQFFRNAVKGENITQSMTEIERIMQTIVLAFEKQLDALFQDEAMDISTDITVLESMLTQEGISSQPSEDGEEPVLKL